MTCPVFVVKTNKVHLFFFKLTQRWTSCAWPTQTSTLTSPLWGLHVLLPPLQMYHLAKNVDMICNKLLLLSMHMIAFLMWMFWNSGQNKPQCLFPWIKGTCHPVQQCGSLIHAFISRTYSLLVWVWMKDFNEALPEDYWGAEWEMLC